jgi:DNA-binding NarL/FixJ family response regulator
MPDTDVLTVKPIKLVIADADPLSRAAMAGIVRERHQVVVAAQATDAVETLELTGHYRPDALLCDESMLMQDDLALVRELHTRFPDVAIVMLTKAPDAANPLEALRHGVNSILYKASPPEQLREALEAVTDGHAIIEPTVTMALIMQLRQTPTAGSGFRPIHSKLTNREWEILDLLVEGAATKEIANRLFLTQDTVYTHVKNILRKMEVRSRAEAVDAAGELYGLRVAA